MWLKLLLIILWMVDLTAMDSDVIGSHEPVHVRVGDDAILPCHLEPPFNVTTLTFEWKWNGKFVYVHRSMKPDLVNKDENFKDRISLFHEEMEKGNISLKVTNVTEVHAGTYTCFVPKLDSQVKRGKVILIVVHPRQSKGSHQNNPSGPPDASTTAVPHPPEDGGMSSGKIAGIVVGCAVLIAAGVVVFKLCKCGGNDEQGAFDLVPQNA